MINDHHHRVLTSEPHLVIAALQGDGPLPVAALTAAVTVLAEPRPGDDDDSCERFEMD